MGRPADGRRRRAHRTGDAPDVPVHLAGRPLSGGLVVPWIAPATPAGVPRFGKISDLSQYVCLSQGRRQVCGQPLPDRTALFARPSDLYHQCTAEPATCPPCAAYSARACPMLDLREFAISEACFGANSSDAGIAKQSNDAWVQEPAPPPA
jgi:hypothetical protein